MELDDQKKWIAVTVIGRDRPGIVASLDFHGTGNA
jgi:hypothetical protein